MEEERGVIDYRLQSVDERLKRIETNIERIAEQNVGRREFLEYKAIIEDRVKTLEDNNRWLGRLVVGAVIVAALGIVMKL